VKEWIPSIFVVVASTSAQILAVEPIMFQINLAVSHCMSFCVR